jgi:hypothetical protein
VPDAVDDGVDSGAAVAIDVGDGSVLGAPSAGVSILPVDAGGKGMATAVDAADRGEDETTGGIAVVVPILADGDACGCDVLAPGSRAPVVGVSLLSGGAGNEGP